MSEFNKLKQNIIDESVKKCVDSLGLCNPSGVKHDQDKLRFDLIPAKAMQSVAQVYTFGAKKYADRNWEKGLSFSRLLGAAHRHINSFETGEVMDSESGCHHLASAVFCLLAIIEFQHRNQNHLDDRVDYKKFEVNL